MSPSPRPSRCAYLGHVETVAWLAPSMVRIVLGGEGLRGFETGAYTDHYVKLQIPPPGADYKAPFELEEIRASRSREHWPRTRTFTVRSWDPERLRLAIDFVVHGEEGFAGPWAAAAEVGDSLQLLGPGGAYASDPGADWHLMVGDLCVVPAIAASLERVPAGAPVRVLLQVATAGDELPLSSPGDLDLTYLRGGGEEALVNALRQLEFPTGRVSAFVHGEAGAVRALRHHLLAERRVAPEDLSISGYWKRSRDEDGWREDKAEWNRLVEADVEGATGRAPSA